MAGFEGARAAILASVSVGAVCVLSSIIALSVVDRLGRRKIIHDWVKWHGGFAFCFGCVFYLAVFNG